jgi:hypothetical protein
MYKSIKKYTVLACISLFIVFSSSCTIQKGSIDNPNKYFNRMQWMEGSWLSSSSSTQQIEIWNKEEMKGYKTEQIIILGRDTIFNEYGSVSYKAEEKNIIYASKIGKYVQEEEEKYCLIKATKRKIIFEIYKNGIRYTTTYQKRGNDKVKLTSTIYVGVEPEVDSYILQKVE